MRANGSRRCVDAGEPPVIGTTVADQTVHLVHHAGAGRPAGEIRPTIPHMTGLFRLELILKLVVTGASDVQS